MRIDFFRKKRGKPFLVLDIGTEAIKSLILEKENGKLSVLGAGIQYFKKYSAFNTNYFNEEIIKKAIIKASELAYKNYIFFSAKDHKIENWKKLPIILGLPADVLKARVVWQTHVRSKDIKISKIEERVILQKIIKNSKKDVSQKFSEESGILIEDISWINLKIIEIKINGYPASNIYGYNGKNFKFKVLAVFLPKRYLRNIEKIFKALRLNVLLIEHLANGLSCAWENKIINGTFIDVGGSITQVFLAKNSILEKVNEFGLGGEFFSQELSEDLGIDENSARNLKEKYANNFLSQNVRVKIKEILLPGKKLWHKNLLNKSKLINFSLNNRLFGGSSLLPEVKELLPNSRIVYPKDLKNINDKTKSLNSPQYTPSLLIAYYAKEIL